MSGRSPLVLVQVLLLREGVAVELLLQPLVGEVDAELLEGVGLEDLEAEDVEHADRRAALAADGRVDAAHEVVEDVGVDGLGERLDGLVRLLHRVPHVLHLASDRDLPLDQRGAERGRVHLQVVDTCV